MLHSTHCIVIVLSVCALLDGVCLSRHKRITYLLTYFIYDSPSLCIRLIVYTSVEGPVLFFVFRLSQSAGDNSDGPKTAGGLPTTLRQSLGPTCPALLREYGVASSPSD